MSWTPRVPRKKRQRTTAVQDTSRAPGLLRSATRITGSYEFHSVESLRLYARLQQYGLPTDGPADILDLDSDRLTNFQEWRAGTDPTNARSALRLLVRRLIG